MRNFAIFGKFSNLNTFHILLFVFMFKIFCFIVLISVFGCNADKNKKDEILQKPLYLFFLENNNEQVLAKTSKVLSTTNSFEITTIATLLQAGAYSELGKLDSAKMALQQLDTIKIYKSKKLRFWFDAFNGLYLFRANNYPQAYQALSRVVTENFDDRAKALSFRLLARIHFSSGDSNKATVYLAQSTDLFTKVGLGKSVAINHKILGRYYANRKEFAKAMERFELAKAGLEKANDSIELFYIHINLIGMKIYQEKFAEAKELAKKNAVYINKNTDRQALALLYNNQGEIELMLHNYDSCRYYYQKTLQLPLGYITDILRRGNACIGISKAFMAENNKLKALHCAYKALEISDSLDLTDLRYNANLNLAELYQKAGDYQKAYYFQNKATPYLEEIGKKSVASSETVYQATINLIELEKQANIVKNEKKVYLILIVLGVAFTVFFLMYGLGTYRLLRSRNEVLKALVKKNLQQISDERKQNEQLQHQLEAKKSTRKATDEDKDFLLFNELNNWLIHEKQYMRKDLTAEIVAHELNTNRDYLSRAISSQHTQFNELINKYRVEEAIQILGSKCDKRNKYNINVIAAEVGFKSMSVFIESFRKQTGMNPAQFRAAACNGEEEK